MKLFTDTTLDELSSKAATSPRRRAHLNIHSSSADPVQRFLVAMNRDSYIRPHRHLTKYELVTALRGRFDIVTFDDTGRMTNRYAIGEGTGNFAYEAVQGTWHTLIALKDGSTFLEIKEGPYDPAAAVDFAPWAPAEGDESIGRCLEWLRTAQPGRIFESR